ncbi:MAG: hypothetical protein JRI95_02055 [Deltaproteobacteria bacterium]|nr:hypothetical protein [Deltaproteobacteria bacterium]
MKQNWFMVFPCRPGVGMALRLLLLLAFLFFGSSVCWAAESEKLTEIMAGLTPGGWRMYEEVRRYQAENLYEKIDGAAELYLSYDVVRLTLAGFENKKDEETFIELFVYDMGTATNAFGIFSVERMNGTPLDLGRAAYRSGAHCFIWKGRYYIKIIVSPETEAVKQIGLRMAKGIASALSNAGEPVWGLIHLPLSNLIPDSIKYFKVDAGGLDFMTNTYTARYRKYGSVINVFLSGQDSVRAAGEVKERYREYALKYGKGARNQSREGMTFVLCDMKNTFDVVFQKGRLVGGVSAVPHQALAVQAAMDLWRQLPHQD